MINYYKNKWEAPFGVQLQEMREIVNSSEYELWVGDDGYSIANPSRKIYDTLDGDETALHEVFGITLNELMNLTVERCGTFYNLDEHFYHEKTGYEYPKEKHSDGKPIIVACLAIEKTKENIRLGRFKERKSD